MRLKFTWFLTDSVRISMGTVSMLVSMFNFIVSHGEIHRLSDSCAKWQPPLQRRPISVPTFSEIIRCGLLERIDAACNAANITADSSEACLPRFLQQTAVLPRLQAWVSVWPRRQLLVIATSALINQPEDTLNRIFQFARLVRPERLELPEENRRSLWPGQLKAIDCPTKQALRLVFAPLNEKLYAQLAQDARQGRRPPEEPDLDRFPDNIPCTSTSLTRVPLGSWVPSCVMASRSLGCFFRGCNG